MPDGPATAALKAPRTRTTPVERRVLGVALTAHALHDGYTDALHYLLLPLWRAEFGLTYAAVGVLRAVCSGTMAAFQRPSALAAGRFTARSLLALGTALVGLAWVAAGASGRLPLAVASLVLVGIGASVQHPLASSAVASVSEGRRSRDRLAAYNFAGDLGKMAIPALTAGLLARSSWRPTMVLLGAAAIVTSTGALLLPRHQVPETAAVEVPLRVADGPPGRPFSLLLAIGVIDSATRMGFLTFMPYLLTAKGASVGSLGVALTLVFAGGAAGKLVCGYLGARVGVVATVIITEGLTAAGILAVVFSPLRLALALLPAIGVCLNGTSSVLYGTVPELVAPERRTYAFSAFYTGTIGFGALSPALYGWIGDVVSVPAMLVVVALMVLGTVPLAWRLREPLSATPGRVPSAG